MRTKLGARLYSQAQVPDLKSRLFAPSLSWDHELTLFVTEFNLLSFTEQGDDMTEHYGITETHWVCQWTSDYFWSVSRKKGLFN